MTGTHGIALQLGGPRRKELRSFFVGSLILHGALLAAFAISPESRLQVPRGVVAVELVALPAPAVAKPAPPAAKPEPVKPVPVAPPPPKPQAKKVVLPAEPTTPKVEPKPEPKVAKRAPKVAKPAPPKPAPQQDYEDVLAQLRAASGETAPAPPAPAPVAVAVAQPVGAPDGVVISSEVAGWLKRAKIHVRNNWTITSGFRTQPLETHVEVDLDASGRVRGEPEITKRSGNPWYDEGVVRAIQKSSPLPAPPEAGKWPFVFVPEDSY